MAVAGKLYVNEFGGRRTGQTGGRAGAEDSQANGGRPGVWRADRQTDENADE